MNISTTAYAIIIIINCYFCLSAGLSLNKKSLFQGKHTE